MQTILMVACLSLPGDKPKPIETEIDQWVFRGDVAIKVAKIVVGKVQVEDLGRRAESKNELCAVYILISNRHETKKMSYHPWGKPSAAGGAATLADEFDNIYKRIGFGFGAKIVGQIQSEESILPQDLIVDVLVFEKTFDKAKRLVLELPGQNIGSDKTLTLSIRVGKNDAEIAADKKREILTLAENVAAQERWLVLLKRARIDYETTTPVLPRSNEFMMTFPSKKSKEEYIKREADSLEFMKSKLERLEGPRPPVTESVLCYGIGRFGSEIEAARMLDKVASRDDLKAIVGKHPGTTSAVKAEGRLKKLNKK